MLFRSGMLPPSASAGLDRASVSLVEAATVAVGAVAAPVEPQAVSSSAHPAAMTPRRSRIDGGINGGEGTRGDLKWR